MSTRKKFTPEEIRYLRANPYTQHVTESTKRLRKAAQMVEGFHGNRLGGVRIKRDADSEPDSAETISDEAARRMQREIVRLQQQMAFLKKVMKLHDKPEE